MYSAKQHDRKTDREGFLSRDVTRACLNVVGIVPEASVALISYVKAGTVEGEMAQRRLVGMGSSGQVVLLL